MLLIISYRNCTDCADLEEYDLDGIVNCDAYREFWILWEDRQWVAIGLGNKVGSEEIMRHSGSYDVNYLHVSTGWGAAGEWRFDECQGE